MSVCALDAQFTLVRWRQTDGGILTNGIYDDIKFHIFLEPRLHCLFVCFAQVVLFCVVLRADYIDNVVAIQSNCCETVVVG